MNESHKNNIYQKKPDKKEYVLNDFIIMKFKNRQNSSMVLQVITFGGEWL